MKHIYVSKLLKSMLALSFSFTFISPSNLVAKTKKVDEHAITANIYPVPQDIKYLSTQGMKLQGDVNIVLHGDQESATLPRLETMLKKHNIRFSVSNSIIETKANILISSDKEHCVDCKNIKTDASTLSHKEAYDLQASDDTNQKGLISIIASDGDGAYYGVLSLGQLLDQSSTAGNIAEVNIKDYPEIEFRGFIEGFYGYPWSHEDRISLMKDTSEYKMNTYIYAPKDDPYHRKNWKALYPDKEASQIAELAKAGKDNNFNFCWTIHPGDTLSFNEADYQALIKKYNQLYELGVRQFGVLFDDTNDWTNGKKQADFINRIDTEFVKEKGDVAPMIVVSARYNAGWGPNMSYFKPYMETLHSDIQIMWTGAATMSNISKEVFDWPRNQTGIDRDVAAWWNYPVNDYCDNRVLMSPLHNLNPNLDNVTGFFSNPMNQAEASKVALYSIADYTWNTDSFDYMESWKKAIQQLVPEASDAFQRFASNVSYLKDDGGSSGPFEFDESWDFESKIEDLEDAMKHKESVIKPATVLLKDFKQLLQDHGDIMNNVKNTNLLKELAPFLGAYKAMAESGVASMEALLSAQDGKIETWLEKSNLAKDKLLAMDSFTINSLEDAGTKVNIVAVGSKRLQPLITNTISFAKEIMSQTMFKEYVPEAISSIAGLEKTKVNFSEGKYSVENVKATFKKQDYFGIALPKATQLSKINIETTHAEKLALEYSINGITWERAETTIQNDVMTTSKSISATYLRLVNISEDTIDFDIKKIASEPVYKATPTISENIGTYQTNEIKNAIDGNMNTKYWSDKGPTAGHHIQLDLGKVMPLYDVKAYFGTTDFLQNAEMLISADGLHWTSLGNLTYTLENAMRVTSFDAKGSMVRFVKMQVNGNNANWTQLFEIEFNKSVVAGDDFVDLTSGNVTGSVGALYDKDLSTAFEVDAIQADSYLNLKMSRITKVSDLIILQDAQHISNATLSVKDLKGNWKTIGKLDKQLNKLNIIQEIVEVKLNFDPTKPMPKIYELIVNEQQEAEVKVDKTKLQQVIKNATKLISNGSLSVLDAIEKAAFEKTFENAKRVEFDEASTQVMVDQAKTDLETSILFVNVKNAKVDLGKLIKEYGALDLSNYVDDKAKLDFIAELTNAKYVLAHATKVEEFTSETTRLKTAFDNMRLTPDKDFMKALQAFVKRVKDLNMNLYSNNSQKVIRDVYQKVNATLKKDSFTVKEMADLRADMQRANALIAHPDATKPTPPSKPEKPGDVPTSDSTNMVATFAIFMFTGVFMITIYQKRKKHEE